MHWFKHTHCHPVIAVCVCCVYWTCQEHQPVEIRGQILQNTSLNYLFRLNTLAHSLSMRLTNRIKFNVTSHDEKMTRISIPCICLLCTCHTHVMWHLCRHVIRVSPSKAWLKALCHFHHERICIKTTNFSLFNFCSFRQMHSFFRAGMNISGLSDRSSEEWKERRSRGDGKGGPGRYE